MYILYYKLNDGQIVMIDLMFNHSLLWMDYGTGRVSTRSLI